MGKEEIKQVDIVPFGVWIKQLMYYLGMVHVLQWTYLTAGQFAQDYGYISSLPFATFP